MLKFWNLLLVTLAVVGVVACTVDNPVDEPQAESKLTLSSEATLEFGAEGGEGVIEYTLENSVEGVELTAECDAAWVVDLTVGEAVTFVVEANEAEEARQTQIVVAYGELSFVVDVNQAAAQIEPEPEPEPTPAPVLTLTSESTMEFSYEGGEGVIAYTLENPVEETMLVAGCAAWWVTDITVGEIITFKVKNNTAEARQAEIVVNYGELSFTVTINQVAMPVPVLTLTSDSLVEFKADGGNGVIEYTIENTVEGIELTAECEAEWVTDLAVGETITFAVAQNQTIETRQTKVVVAYGALSFEVTVKQTGESVGFDGPSYGEEDVEW